MIRTRVWIDASSALARAGLRAMLDDEEIEIVENAELADVAVRDQPPLPHDATGYPSIVLVSDAPVPRRLSDGVRAILPAHVEASQLTAAVRAVAAGLVAAPVEATELLLLAHGPEEGVEHLTARETEVLEMLAEGLGNKQIAGALAISEHTVKFHVNSILGKLEAGTRTEAVTRGIRAGILKL